jgi:hypothetical protein
MRLAALLLFVLSLLQPTVVHAQAAIKPETAIRLFDGKTLDQFETWLVDTHGQDPLRVFSVVDQVDGAPAIRISGEKWGGLITKAAYRDYHLTVEFRWGLLTWGDRRNRARDSGVLVHAQGEPGNTGRDMNGPWMRSIEAQIIEGGVGDIILVAGFERSGTRIMPALAARTTKDRDGETVFDPAGASQPAVFTSGRINWYGRDPDWRDELGFRGRQDVESPWGQWTRMEVIARGDSLTYLVNGKVVNEGTAASFAGGRIIIQSEGAEIFFRKIELTPAEERK